MLVSDIVRRNADYFADRDAVVVPGRETLSWSRLEERTNQLARAMLELGLRKGDRLAMFAPNGAEYIEFFFACAKAGLIGAALNVRLSPHELGSYLGYVEPRAILVHEQLGSEADKFLSAARSIQHVVGIGADHGRALDYEGLLAAQSAAPPAVDVDEHDPYQLCATSGTTGVPKAAVLTHQNAIAALLSYLVEFPCPENATNLQNIPMFFNAGGPSGLHPVLLKGGRTVIFPAFDPATFLPAVPEHQVTHTILVPTMIQMIVEHPDATKHDMSSLQAIMTGGSPVTRELLRRARPILGDVFRPIYGMAETYSCGTILRPENQFTEGTDAQLRRLSSVGKPKILMQVRVVGDDGNDVPRDNETAGEIWMRGDTVAKEYFRMPEETALAHEGDWFKTGDVATVDEEGFITIVDRKKDIIITGGINVFSREIEEALSEHPEVSQVAAIGIPHERWGEAVHAIVVLVPGGQVSEDELLEFAAARLASFKKPRSIEIRDHLPISGTGKILKKELRKEYWEADGRSTADA